MAGLSCHFFANLERSSATDSYLRITAPPPAQSGIAPVSQVESVSSSPSSHGPPAPAPEPILQLELVPRAGRKYRSYAMELKRAVVAEHAITGWPGVFRMWPDLQYRRSTVVSWLDNPAHLLLEGRQRLPGAGRPTALAASQEAALWATIDEERAGGADINEDDIALMGKTLGNGQTNCRFTLSWVHSLYTRWGRHDLAATVRTRVASWKLGAADPDVQNSVAAQVLDRLARIRAQRMLLEAMAKDPDIEVFCNDEQKVFATRKPRVVCRKSESRAHFNPAAGDPRYQGMGCGVWALCTFAARGPDGLPAKLIPVFFLKDNKKLHNLVHAPGADFFPKEWKVPAPCAQVVWTPNGAMRQQEYGQHYLEQVILPQRRGDGPSLIVHDSSSVHRSGFVSAQFELSNVWSTELVPGTTCETQLFDLYAAASLRAGFQDAQRWVLRQRSEAMRDKPLTIGEKYNVRMAAYLRAYWDPDRIKLSSLAHQFKAVGITNKTDGSEDHLINISVTGTKLDTRGLQERAKELVPKLKAELAVKAQRLADERKAAKDAVDSVLRPVADPSAAYVFRGGPGSGPPSSSCSSSSSSACSSSSSSSSPSSLSACSSSSSSSSSSSASVGKKKKRKTKPQSKKPTSSDEEAKHEKPQSTRKKRKGDAQRVQPKRKSKSSASSMKDDSGREEASESDRDSGDSEPEEPVSDGDAEMEEEVKQKPAAGDFAILLGSGSTDSGSAKDHPWHLAEVVGLGQGGQQGQYEVRWWETHSKGCRATAKFLPGWIDPSSKKAPLAYTEKGKLGWQPFTQYVELKCFVVWGFKLDSKCTIPSDVHASLPA